MAKRAGIFNILFTLGVVAAGALVIDSLYSKEENEKYRKQYWSHLEPKINDLEVKISYLQRIPNKTNKEELELISMKDELKKLKETRYGKQ